jgi:hypothetical protein
MSQPVTFENDALRIDVWPMTGGKISSIVDKADRFDLLFNYPDELPTDPQYDMPYQNSWYAGWDECFPAVAPCRYPGHPYDGIAVPDHGELWGLPTVAVPTKNGITTVWHGLRFGYRLTRKLSIDGPALLAEYTLVNVAPFDFHFVWAAHGLMSLAAEVEIDAGDGTGYRFGHDAEGREHGESFAWPHAAAGEDLGRPAGLPAKRGWKVFSAAPLTDPVRVRYPTRGRHVTIEYAAEGGAPDAFWGIWINTGGWAGHRHFAIEPTTGRYDQLDRSVRDGSAGRLPGFGRLGWTVRWTLGALE